MVWEIGSDEFVVALLEQNRVAVSEERAPESGFGGFGLDLLRWNRVVGSEEQV